MRKIGFLFVVFFLSSPAWARPSARPEKTKAKPTEIGAKMVLPSAMELDGAERRVAMSSSLGPIDLRWERSVERLFGSTPERAVAEAAQSVKRAINRGGFPVAATKLSLKWDVVFFDENIPSGQVPTALITGCHPGWMTGDGKAAHIYIRARAVSAGCSGASSARSSVADVQLARVVIHEMGHGIEQAMLDGVGGTDRLRAEGFASWFEQYAAESSPSLRSEKIGEAFIKLATQRHKQDPGPFNFQGTAYDYAYASMYFRAIESRFGVRRVFEAYDVMKSDRIGFFEAIQKRFSWDRQRLEQEVLRLLS